MTDATEQMAPDASPGEMPKRAGVRRVNNMPLYILGAVLGAFLLVMMLVAMDRAKQQQQVAVESDKPVGSSTMFAQGIAGKETNGIIPAAVPPVPEIGEVTDSPIIIAKPTDLDQPPLPPEGARQGMNLDKVPRDEDMERIRMAKMQMFEEAVKARTGVQTMPPRSSASAPGHESTPPRTREEMAARIAAVQQQIDAARGDDPTAAYQARLAQVRSLIDNQTGGGTAGGVGGATPSLVQTSARGDQYGQFDSRADSDRWRLDSSVEAPRSPFELRAGFVIPATLISGINSELPGQIMAQVSQTVYDTATGKYELIPQGARLIGSYSSDVAYGQARVLIAWQRIIFPDGKALDIGSMPGADSAGYSGFKDKVNNHYLRIFGSAFLMSAVTAGVTLSQDNDNSNSNSQRASDAMSEALGQQLGQVTAQMISKNLNIAPTLEIRPGYRFNVVVTKDMTFSKPYQSFDY